VDNPAEDIQQPYDMLIKAFFRTEIDTLVSHFLKGATLDGTLEYEKFTSTTTLSRLMSVSLNFILF